MASILVAVVVVIVIGAIAGYAIYRQEIEPFETVVLRIDDKEIKMRYFLKRLQSMQGDPSFKGPTSLLALIAQEEIIKDKAAKAPYNLKATEAEIDEYLKTVARRGSESISEEEYKEWYRQQLNLTQLAESEFRELARLNVLRQELTEYLAVRAPTVAEQVHPHMIIMAPEKIQDVVERLEKGENFLKLAGELNPTEELRENQGDMGWQTKNALIPMVAHTAFQLEVGVPSKPIPLSEKTYAIIMVKEKAAARELSEQMKQIQKLRLAEEWAMSEFKFHKISFHGFKNGWDSETDAWARWQLYRMNSDKQDKK